MVGRKPAHYLAPIALVAAVVGTYLIVKHHVGSSSPAATVSHLTDRGPAPRGRYARATFYTVQAGDNLTRISTRTGIPISTLEQLNQSLNDPNNLQAGQRIRLRQ